MSNKILNVSDISNENLSEFISISVHNYSGNKDTIEAKVLSLLHCTDYLNVEKITPDNLIKLKALYMKQQQMFTITNKQYETTHKDFKGVWSSDDIHGTNNNGKRTIIHYINGTCLLIENTNFIIVNTEAENINPLRK